MASISSNLVLEAIPIAERLSSAVYRVLGLNPSMLTLQGTNTYIVGTGTKRVLIDAGEADKPEYVKLLKETLASLKVRLSHIIVTHWHQDHLGGVEPVWNMAGEPRPKVYKLPHPPSTAHLDNEYFTSSFPGLEYISDGDVIRTEGATLRALATPGHSDDHMAILHEEDQALFSGDCILGQGSAVFENLKDYMESLHKLRSLNPKIIYPGHGPVLRDPVPIMDAYIEHRMKRENQILEVLKGSSKPITSMEIVETLYKDVPQSLWKPADNNVRLHLQKLCQEDKVGELDDKYILKRNSSI